MSDLKHKIVIGLLVLTCYAGFVLANTPDEDDALVIHVDASKFAFRPDGITLKKGVPVILEFTSKDAIMGFSAPELKTRADIIPGKVTRVRIVPDKVGVIAFFCDIFCGSGHEDMSGTITVVD